MAPIQKKSSPYLSTMGNYEEKELANILLQSFSELGEGFRIQSGTFGTTSEKYPEPSYERKPVIFLIFLSILLASNLFTFIMRIYKNSITSTNTNIIITMNSYIYELYNLAVTIMVN